MLSADHLTWFSEVDSISPCDPRIGVDDQPLTTFSRHGLPKRFFGSVRSESTLALSP